MSGKNFKNNNFYGKINGFDMASFIKDLDYSIESTEERIGYIREKLGTYNIDEVEFYNEFFEVIFDQESKQGKIDLLPNRSKCTYTETNIALGLEILGSYILNAPQEREERKEKINYKIYNSKELFDRAIQEENLIYKLATVNSDKSNNFEYSNENDYNDPRKDLEYEGGGFIIFQLPKNYKKVKDIIITPKDFRRYPILKEYQDSIDHMKTNFELALKINEERMNDEERKEFKQYKNALRRNIKTLKLDMLDLKKILQRPIIWKAPLKDNGCPSWDELDMFDKKIVKELLRVHKGNDLQDDLTCIIEDLKILIEKINFTDKQRKILNMWSCGMTAEDISKYTKTTGDAVLKALDTIVNKIIKQYEEEYTDWYYLNICKGEYKKCSKCGEIRLINNFRQNGKGGYRSECKKCR